MFTGKYTAKIDSVGRVTVPARLRDGLGKRFIISAGVDECLWAYAEEQWQQEIMHILQQLPSFSRGGGRAIRYLSSSAQPVDMDKQSRVVLPEALRAQAAIGDEVVFVGVLKRVEIWALERWEKEAILLESDDTRETVRKMLAGVQSTPGLQAGAAWERASAPADES